MNILVLGGSRFFGKRLVRQLVRDGHEVTVATRGRQKLEELGFGAAHAVVDRSDRSSMLDVFGGREFDLVYDQIGYTPRDAKIVVDLFAGRIGRYVFTSTMAVYDGSEEPIEESAFDPYAYPVDLAQEGYTYKEGKRQAESYLFRHADFPVVAVRPPFVISVDDDYTGRFLFHVDKLVGGQPIHVADSTEVSFVDAGELASFLNFVGTKSDFAGPVNASNTGYLDTERLCRLIADLLGTSPIFEYEGADRSPYCVGETWKCSNRLAESLGFGFEPLETAIARLVGEWKSKKAQ
ncbi:NAD-dependent epimerase/dehydratase family protein [Paenibacillus sp. GYB003]|uniref:NAD-dependent epimerase/dehydratase family protein n=1 Tax=Paenibacillus sp. GYB003 TaxID=2994392 RepID=UPI002F961834